jgi:hypothetical protein
MFGEMSRDTFPPPEPETGSARNASRGEAGSKIQQESNMKRIITKWITVRIARHADFGAGLIEADLPDTPYHRAYYPVLRAWTQVVEA